MQQSLTIGKLAREAGIGIETVRYYERRGLIPKPVRRPSGYRDYGPATVERLRFIRQAKHLGFTLHEIADLLALSETAGASCGDISGRARVKMAEVQEKIDALEELHSALGDLASACDAQSGADCSILQTPSASASGAEAGQNACTLAFGKQPTGTRQ